MDDESSGTPMHCDVVVSVDLLSGKLEAIGGNVQQSVARTLVDLDSEGRVSGLINPHRPWGMVLRARHGAGPYPDGTWPVLEAADRCSRDLAVQ
jgi:hypothetical protein